MRVPDLPTESMFTFEQIRRMLPTDAATTHTAIRSRCIQSGAHYLSGGWPASQLDPISRGATTVPSVDPGTDPGPLEVYTFDQVIEIATALGWHPTAGNVRFRLAGMRVRSFKGYAPADAVLKAMRRPAGSAWRKNVKGQLHGRRFDAVAPAAEADPEQ